MATLVTFPGKYGDLLWSLPTVRTLAKDDAVDLAVMPRFAPLLNLLNRQPYIREAYALPGWDLENDYCGAQPALPRPEALRGIRDDYKSVKHLGYPRRPDQPLLLYTAKQAGVELLQPVLPFLEEREPLTMNLVSYAFNDMHRAVKLAALNRMRETFPSVEFYDVSKIKFEEASRIIASSAFFMGCRSACAVIAHGLFKRCLIVEPDPGRREFIFACPYGREAMPFPDDHVGMANLTLRWLGWDRNLTVKEEQVEST